MSTASHPLSGKPSFTGLLGRIIFIVLLWAALVIGTLHYVGYAWPKAYQIALAEKAQADERAMNALSPPPSSPTPAAAAPAGPAASAASTPAAETSAATPSAAAPTGSATSAAPAAAATPAAASAPAAATGEQKLPFDLRLAGYNRTALGNVSIFFSIVISVFCVGTIILQIFKYKQANA